MECGASHSKETVIDVAYEMETPTEVDSEMTHVHMCSTTSLEYGASIGRKQEYIDPRGNYTVDFARTRRS